MSIIGLRPNFYNRNYYTVPHRVALKFRDNPKLLENVTMLRKVLELMSDKEFKNRYDVNEVCKPIMCINSETYHR